MSGFESSGFSVVDDLLSPEDAGAVSDAFVGADWDMRYDQVRESHYSHVFAWNQDDFPVTENFPTAKEPYLAQFSRSQSLEGTSLIKRVVENNIGPVLNRHFDKNVTKFDVRCYGMFEGDFMRAHVDDYAGDIGFIYYATRNWVWDWGGLLCIAQGDGVQTLLPKHNRLAIINHGTFRNPHFVSAISSYAQDARFTIVGFCS